MRKPAAIVLSLLLAAAAGGYGYYYYNIRDASGKGGSKDERRVFVTSVSWMSQNGTGSGRLQRYGGEVEPHTTWSVRKEEDQEILKTYVEEGDHVEVGTKLFSYDPTSIENAIEKNEIEIGKQELELVSAKKGLEDDKKRLNTLKTQAERNELALEISQEENSIKSNEYALKKKEIERERLQNNLKNTDVFSEMEGVVRSVNTGTDSDSNSDSFITIMAEGEFRVKAKINEQNISEIAVGDRMIVYSRMNQEKIWYGSVTQLDTSSGETNSSGSYYSGNSRTAVNSTNYSFYVTLDASEGLLLGEHVYLEKDEGQLEERTGIWLDETYITNKEGENGYVWAENRRHVLEQRAVVLGAYDALLGRYEITEGLTDTDYIAWPMAYLSEGMTATRTEYGQEEADELPAEETEENAL